MVEGSCSLISLAQVLVVCNTFPLIIPSLPLPRLPFPISLSRILPTAQMFPLQGSQSSKPLAAHRTVIGTQAEGAVSHGVGCAFSKLFAVNLILHYHTFLPM